MNSLRESRMKRRYRKSGIKDIWLNYQRKILGNAQNYSRIVLLSAPGKVLNRIILERMKMTLDSKLWDHEAGFRRKDHAPTR